MNEEEKWQAILSLSNDGTDFKVLVRETLRGVRKGELDEAYYERALKLMDRILN